MDERKMDVIPVAIRLFSEKGYHATSVEEIAKESGMAKGSFYKLFHSKEDLLFEIFTIIPEQIKKDLTKVYSQKYETPLEKLTDFMIVSIESILSHQVYALSMALFELPFFKNKKMLETAEKIHTEMNAMMRDFLLDLYGEKIRDYIWDLVLLQRGLVMQYMYLYRDRHSTMNVKQVAAFISTVIDIAVEGLVERKPQSVIDGDYPVECLLDDNHPFIKGQRLNYLFTSMKQSIKESKQDSQEQEEYLKTVSLLEEECRKKEPETFLVKALIHYLKNLPESGKGCLELMDLLQLKQDF